jgi:hypothetical protein
MVFVPIPSGDPPLGIAVSKRIVEPFTDDEIATLQTFATHAGNAVTNAQTLQDLDQRGIELAESLELRTATSAILELISANPGDLTQVFDAVIAEACRLCDVLREFHHAVGPMIFEHDGTIAQFTGDGMLVFFNDPVQLDDPAWQAVRLAVAMRDRTAELSARVCAIAAGGQILATNEVFAAIEDRVDATPMGDVEFKGLSRPVPIVEITALR